MRPITWNSVKAWGVINSGLTLLGVIKSYICNAWNYSFASILATELISNQLQLMYFRWATKDKERVHSSELIPKEQYPGEFTSSMVVVTIIKSGTHWLLLQNITPDTLNISWYWSLVMMIPKAFVFEFIFDGVHYFGHRLMHENKWLYRNVHKKHHKFITTSEDAAYYINPVDLTLAYSLPLVISTLIVPTTKMGLHVNSVYMTYQEIGGHLGKKMYPTCSFPQCIWLVRLLGIELYAEEHQIHHTQFNFNYSKRFSFWDKFLGTHKEIR